MESYYDWLDARRVVAQLAMHLSCVAVAMRGGSGGVRVLGSYFFQATPQFHQWFCVEGAMANVRNGIVAYAIVPSSSQMHEQWKKEFG